MGVIGKILGSSVVQHLYFHSSCHGISLLFFLSAIFLSALTFFSLSVTRPRFCFNSPNDKFFICMLALWLKPEKPDMHIHKNGMNKNNRLSPFLEAPISVSSSKLYHNVVVYYKKSSIYFFSGRATQTTQTNKWLSWQQMLQSRPQGFGIVMATTLTSIHKNQTPTVSGPVLPFCWNAAVQDGASCSLSNK